VTLQNQGLTFDFSKWTTTAYQRVLSNSQIWIGFKNALLYSILFTIISLVVTLLAAYPMSRDDFKGKGFFNLVFMITMFFGGGLIPTYLLISRLHMLDSMWAVILPPAFGVYNMIIARTYYQGIPKDLQEAAEIDGANEMVYFFRVLLPVCTPIIATIAMWNFVGMWNSYFDAMIYLNSASKQPLQLVLRSILIQSQPEPGMVADTQSTAQRAQLAELLKYATIIISSIPLLIMYPFFQRYFDSGIMAGAVKG
jgi:putative aldouronate transport system permease protein